MHDTNSMCLDSKSCQLTQVRENLELSLVQEAEMVFTTLSSTGRKIFSHLENAFENVLVDEAAQASEIAVLQPLMLGCKRCAVQSTAPVASVACVCEGTVSLQVYI